MNSKGLTTVALNWIFVLIAGGVILLFFFNLLSMQTKISEGEATGRILRDLEAVLIGKSVSEGTDSIIHMPRRMVSFSCEEPCTQQTGCQSDFGVSNGEFSFATATQVLFSASQIQSDFVYAFALAWDVPFRVTNFLYLVSPTQKIVFEEVDTSDCGSGTLCKRVYDQVPQRLKDSGIVLKGELNGGYAGGVASRLTLVQFGNCGSILNSPNPGTLRTLCVDGAKNTITFSEDPAGEVVLAYFGDESILGAIFSEDSSFYECNMKKAFYRLNRVEYSISQKMELLKGLYDGSGFPTDACYSELNLAITTDDLMGPYQYSYHEINAGETDRMALVQTPGELETLNNYIQRRSCAAIY